jgi:putative heme-binding domain-containing protein
MWAVRVFILVLISISAAPTLFAQREYPPATLELGKRLFLANCTGCHGPDGDAVSGVDLGRNKFRRAASDEDLIRIIKTGIPGTAMPPHNFADFPPGTPSAVSQTEAIVAYLHYMAESPDRQNVTGGDATRGKAIFEGKGGCLNCHRVKGSGSRLGPELSDIGLLHRSVELERSILEPDAEVLLQNRFFRVVTRAGVTINGRLLNQDTFTVQVFDAKERLLSFPKSDLKEYGFIDKSPMPSYRDKLSSTEVADLVNYLSSLKGINKQ